MRPDLKPLTAAAVVDRLWHQHCGMVRPCPCDLYRPAAVVVSVPSRPGTAKQGRAA